MPNDVQGEFVKFTTAGKFEYRYTCPECKRKFVESSPTLSAPTLCEWCYHHEDIPKSERKDNGPTTTQGDY